jgi:CPA2 family monovalent cation:H+ antiporter-2
LVRSGIRDKYNCMVVGLERGEENLWQPDPDYVFQKGDIVWVVGEEDSLREIC